MNQHKWREKNGIMQGEKDAPTTWRKEARVMRGTFWPSAHLGQAVNGTCRVCKKARLVSRRGACAECDPG